MGIIFDLVRITRKIVKHPNLFVQIEDMLYWIVCGLLGFYMLYVENYAAIRPFVFLGMLLGGIFYFATFSIVFMKIATIVIEYIRKLIKKLIALILIPLKGLINFIKIPLRYIDYQLKRFRYYKKQEARKLKRKKYLKQADKYTERYLKKQKN